MNSHPGINLSQPSGEFLAGKASNSTLPDVSSLADGQYNYEITVATDKTIEVTDNGNNGRGENAKTTVNVSETQSGHFRVQDGAIVIYADIKEVK